MKRIALACLGLIALSACTKDDPDDTAALSHAVDIQPIWEDSCAGCHTGGTSSGELALDEGYAAMVGVPASQLDTMNLVEPGDRDNSYLWLKLEDTHEAAGGSGEEMPSSGTLGDADRATIGEWIDAGAPE
jgi:hypothetical protein